MGCNSKKTNEASFNLSFFLDYCRKDERLSTQIEKVYEVVIYAFLVSLQKQLNNRAMSKLDGKTKTLLEDFRVIQHFFLNLDNIPLELLPINDFHLFNTDRNNGCRKTFSSSENAIKIKYITLDNHTVSTNDYKISNEKIVIVCKDAEKAVIKNLVIQLGLKERIRGIIPERTLIDWYHKCISPKYKDSMGKTVMETLSLKFEKEFPLIPMSSTFGHYAGS